MTTTLALLTTLLLLCLPALTLPFTRQQLFDLLLYKAIISSPKYTSVKSFPYGTAVNQIDAAAAERLFQLLRRECTKDLMACAKVYSSGSANLWDSRPLVEPQLVDWAITQVVHPRDHYILAKLFMLACGFVPESVKTELSPSALEQLNWGVGQSELQALQKELLSPA
jgi:hypothetical protein